MTLRGLRSCDQKCQDQFVATQIQHILDFFSNLPGIDITNIVLVITKIVSVRRRLEDGSGITITYDYSFDYSSNESDISVSDLVEMPFKFAVDLSNFVDLLIANGGATFEDLSGVSNLFIPATQSPTGAPVTFSSLTGSPTNTIPMSSPSLRPTLAPTLGDESSANGLSSMLSMSIVVAILYNIL